MLGVLFWSLFSSSLARQSRFCSWESNICGGPCCSIDGVEALGGSGAGCSMHPADMQIKGFLPQRACWDGEVCEGRWGFRRGRGGSVGKRNPCLPHAHSWPEVHCSQRQAEAGSLDYILLKHCWLRRLQSKNCQKVHLQTATFYHLFLPLMCSTIYLLQCAP